jgi:hypothetical protein
VRDVSGNLVLHEVHEVHGRGNIPGGDIVVRIVSENSETPIEKSIG